MKTLVVGGSGPRFRVKGTGSVTLVSKSGVSKINLSNEVVEVAYDEPKPLTLLTSSSAA